MDSGCSHLTATTAMWELGQRQGMPLHGVIGPGCEEASKGDATLARLQETPQISARETSPVLSDTESFSHFFRNLFLHIAHVFGRLLHLRASATFQYPEELRPLMSRYRSRHRLTVREDNTPRCVGCMLCETVCPARCITIVPDEHPDPNVEKYPVRFDIDLGVCVYCGYCVEVCPEDAIRMDTGILDLAWGGKLGIPFHGKGLRESSTSCGAGRWQLVSTVKDYGNLRLRVGCGAGDSSPR